jgi:uncharacterized FlaG/YvyC family protein
LNHFTKSFQFKDDEKMNRLVVRIYDLSSKKKKKRQLSSVSIGDDEKAFDSPSFEYSVEKVNKHFQIDASHLRIQ